MKILITGASGLLGSKLFEILSKHNEVVGTYFSKKTYRCSYFDITDRRFVGSFFNKIDPQVVVHTAAISDADYCEENHEAAKITNITGTNNIIEACKMHDCKMVFISSDYVFDGNNGPYSEESNTGPLNYYSITKVVSENAIQNELEDYIIVRPAILYGYNGFQTNGVVINNFVIKVVYKLKRGE